MNKAKNIRLKGLKELFGVDYVVFEKPFIVKKHSRRLSKWQ